MTPNHSLCRTILAENIVPSGHLGFMHISNLAPAASVCCSGGSEALVTTNVVCSRSNYRLTGLLHISFIKYILFH